MDSHWAYGAALARGAGVPDAACEWIGACGQPFDGGGAGVAGGLPLEARIVRVACECDALIASRRGGAARAPGGDRRAARLGGRRARPRRGREPRRDPRARRIESSARAPEVPRDPRGQARPAEGASRPGDPLGVRRGRRKAAREGQADRPGADRQAARPGFLRGARHVRAPPDLRVRDAEAAPLGRCRGHRVGDDRRAAGRGLLAGLHGVRGLARRGDGGEDVQGHGPGREDRRAGDRDQRLGRGADPGGGGLARRLRRRVRAKRPVLGRDPADQPDHGALRRRGGLLPRDDRLHLHGQGDLAHVHHRP